jgi:hypothetical protein
MTKEDAEYLNKLKLELASLKDWRLRLSQSAGSDPSESAKNSLERIRVLQAIIATFEGDSTTPLYSLSGPIAEEAKKTKK